MRIERILTAAPILWLVSACIPSHPTRTARPEVEISPWAERTVKSASSCASYRYLHLDGPAPGAPVVLLLPGGFYDARIFLNMRALAERFEVYALDWPDGCAFYTGHVGDYGEIAADFLAAVGVRSLYVGGVSMGTYAAIDLVSRKTELDVRGLVLFSTVMFAVNEDEISRRSRMGNAGLRLGPEKMRALVELGVRRAKYEKAPGAVQQDEIFWVRPYSYYFQLFNMVLNQGATRQATGEIRCPTLLVQGDNDEVMPVELARLSPTAFPSAKYVEIPGGAHSMIFSRGPELAKIVVDFFR
jgi:pimeloyl-ACP methyl ester carboxylesterase